jgi:hypothetical protein
VSFVGEKSMLSEDVEWTLATCPCIKDSIFENVFTSFKTQQIHPDNIREHICPDILDPSHRNTSVSQMNNYMFYTEPCVMQSHNNSCRQILLPPSLKKVIPGTAVKLFISFQKIG